MRPIKENKQETLEKWEYAVSTEIKSLLDQQASALTDSKEAEKSENGYAEQGKRRGISTRLGYNYRMSNVIAGVVRGQIRI